MEWQWLDMNLEKKKMTEQESSGEPEVCYEWSVENFVLNVYIPTCKQDNIIRKIQIFQYFS